jgi:hypothetical protein
MFDANQIYMSTTESSKEFLLRQLDVLKNILDPPNSLKSARFNELQTLCCQIVLFSHSVIMLSRASHVSETYLISRSVLDTATNFCYLLACDESEYERYIDFSRRNVLKAIETKTKAFESIGHIVEMTDFRSLDPEITCVFEKFTSPKKGKDLTRWETDVSLNYKKS